MATLPDSTAEHDVIGSENKSTCNEEETSHSESDDNEEYETGSSETDDDLQRSTLVTKRHDCLEDTKIDELNIETILGLAMTSSADTSDDIHHAVLTCFLQDQAGTVHGLTSGHVVQSSGGNILDRSGKVFGKCLTCDKCVKLQPDVGLFEVSDTNSLTFYRNHAYNVIGSLKPCKMFKGNVRDLYGKPVYKCVPVSRREEGLTDKGTTLLGRVASQQIHSANQDIVSEHSFLVTCDPTGSKQAKTDSVGFSVKGESGTPLGLLSDSDVITLVGSVSGQANISEMNDTNADHVLCAFLPSAIHFLNEQHDKQLVFPYQHSESEDVTGASSLVTVDAVYIECGGYIFMKTLEKISPSDFEIADRLCYMTALRFDEDSHDYMPHVRKYEASLRQKVYSRGSMNFPAIFYPDGAEQRTLLLNYLTVQALMSGKLKQGRVLLKAAIATLGKAMDSTIHILSKCITFATFLYLSTNEIDKAAVTFETGIDFYESNMEDPYFPKESYGFHYYNYSKYFVRQGDRDRAVETGLRCHNIVKAIYEQKLQLVDTALDKAAAIADASDFYNRYIMAVCNLTHTLLWCGENFQKKYREVSVPSSDVNTSEKLLKGIVSGIETAPAVQKLEYLLSICNLLYRKQNYNKALECAEECLDISQDNNLSEELVWSRSRIRVLTKIITATY